MKNKKLVIGIICALVVLIAAGCVVLFFVLNNEDEDDDGDSSGRKKANTELAEDESKTIKHGFGDKDETETEEDTDKETTSGKQEEETKPQDIAITSAELDRINRDLHGLFIGSVYDFDSSSVSFRDFVVSYLFPILDSPAYAYYFGSPDGYGGYSQEWIDVSVTPDPLHRFESGMEYIVLSVDNINWIAENVYNIPKQKIDAASIEDYLYTAEYEEYSDTMVKVRCADNERYYYDGNIYQIVGGYGFESSFRCTDCVPVGNGRYSATIVNYYYDYDNDKEVIDSVVKAILLPKTFNGTRYWSLISAETVG